MAGHHSTADSGLSGDRQRGRGMGRPCLVADLGRTLEQRHGTGHGQATSCPLCRDNHDVQACASAVPVRRSDRCKWRGMPVTRFSLYICPYPLLREGRCPEILFHHSFISFLVFCTIVV